MVINTIFELSTQDTKEPEGIENAKKRENAKKKKEKKRIIELRKKISAALLKLEPRLKRQPVLSLLHSNIFLVSH